MAKPGRFFRVLIFLLLLGIFLELASIISILTGVKHGENGNLAIVTLKGPIEDSRDVVDQIKTYADSEHVKAMVLRIDSPGGTVGASQEIHDSVVTTAKKKPVVVSMGDLAASGGYYAAAGATKIVANPGTITGSIGVIAHFVNAEDLLKKTHLRWEVIKSGSVKDIGSPLRPMTPEERKLMQSLTDDMHAQFMEAVAKGRKLPIDKVRALATGRVFSGRQAKEVGLVDELGGLEHAIEIAAKLGKIEGKPEVIEEEEEKFGWLRRLAEGKFEAPGLKIEYRLAP